MSPAYSEPDTLASYSSDYTFLISWQFWNMSVLAKFCFVLTLFHYCSGQCRDVDTLACELMLRQNPGLCKDPVLSETACPKFCKLCPVTCYHCDVAVQNHTDCNATKLCHTGERCMLRELTSARDGHHEYQMNCASLDMCDGLGLMAFGKRDITTHCCSEDLCNSPSSQVAAVTQPVTQPPAKCNRDIEFILEDSGSIDANAAANIKQFLKDFVGQIDVGPTANLIGAAVFDSLGVHGKIRLDEKAGIHTHNGMDYQHGLLNEIDRIDFSHRPGHLNITKLLLFLQNELQDGNHHDRAGYTDVAIIIADHTSRVGRSIQLSDRQTAKTTTYDVILINVGHVSGSLDFLSTATDPSHVINVNDYASLSNIMPQLIALLCK